MTEAGNGGVKAPHASGDPVPLESILCTEELRRRRSRLPDYKQENQALVALAETLSVSPQTILQKLADTILEVCRAGSAGISLLTKDDGGKRFFWPAIAGEWKQHIGGGTPRDFGPCGDVLDRNMPLLMRQVHLRYTYFEPVKPGVQEALLVPFYVHGKAVGTIWAVAHDDHKFDSEDERVLRSLGKFASSAYQIREALEAAAAQAAEAKEGQRAAALLASIVDSSDDAIVSKNLDGVITSWNRSAQEMFGYTVEEAVGQHITLIIPTDRREEETHILESLRSGKRISHFETVRQRKDGSKLDISVTISPVRDSAGQIVGASKVARDITARKRGQEALRESEERLRALADHLESEVRKRTQELEERNFEVLQQAQRLRELSIRSLNTQDEERRRIARDLHDSVGQVVTTLGMYLSTIAQQAVKPEIRHAAKECHALVRELSKEIRTVSYLLHPPLLDETGLSEALRWYAKGLAERSGLNVQADIPVDFGRLPDDVEVAIFRIVQECLTNIHRHSGGTTATIRLWRDSSVVSLEIQDDGKGIAKQDLAVTRSKRLGVGLTGMRERARHLGGKFDIQSGPSGTTVLVTIPLMTNLTADTQIAEAASAGE